VGPYFTIAVPAPIQPFPGRQPRIMIEGTLLDGAGAPVPDGLVETWQAGGELAEGLTRIPTDDQGRFLIDTVRPDAVRGPEGCRQAPHLVVRILARGILTQLLTRIYLEGDPANDSDPVLSLVPSTRRPRLIARALGPDRYRHDLVLQGANETVFFDV
jgi:protocatechuate 3,4-dioxygenase alpha subunit